MTDIKEPINTTSDGTFLSVVCEILEKVLLAKGGRATAPPGITPWNNGFLLALLDAALDSF